MRCGGEMGRWDAVGWAERRGDMSARRTELLRHAPAGPVQFHEDSQ
jgi:hypothetical protein